LEPVDEGLRGLSGWLTVLAPALDGRLLVLLSAKVGAMSEGMCYLREQSDIHGPRLSGSRSGSTRTELLGSINARLDRHGELPEDILLPLPPNAPEA
jgi:hypothetical protein